MDWICCTPRAFAAILEDGSVLTWGDPGRGGDSSAVRGQLKGVQQIQYTYCKWIESAAHPGLLLRFWKMDPSLLGEIQAAVVTVRQFEVSSRVCSRFNPLTVVSGLNLLHAQGFCCDSGRWIRPYLGRSRPRWWQLGSSRSAQGCAARPGPLLRFWKMDPSLLGALRAGAVTVRQFEVSWAFAAMKMDASWPGVGNTMVVTVRYKMSSGVFSPGGNWKLQLESSNGARNAQVFQSFCFWSLEPRLKFSGLQAGGPETNEDATRVKPARRRFKEEAHT